MPARSGQIITLKWKKVVRRFFADALTSRQRVRFLVVLDVDRCQPRMAYTFYPKDLRIFDRLAATATC
jgi:hypothetical protein